MKPKKNIKGLVITHVVEEGLVFLLEVEEVVEQTSAKILDNVFKV